MKRLLLVIWAVTTATALFFFTSTSAWAFQDSTKLPVPTITGNYVDNYGGHQLITKTKWVSGTGKLPLTFTYTSVDNKSQVIIAKNTFDQGDGFNYTGKFSQFNWTRFDNALWYCQIEYKANTAKEAASHPPADRSDPSKGGCSTFPWSKLIPRS
jgi:hypothetical protein